MSPYKIEAGTAQHIGGQPQQNDRAALFTGARSPGYVMAVLSDGMNGNASAAEQVLQTSKQLFHEFVPGDNPGIQRLYELVRAIAYEAHLIIKMHPVPAGKVEPTCTFVVFLMTPTRKAVWGHVGDSRLYRFHSGNCMLRTSDATYVNHLIEVDKLPVEAAKAHRQTKLLSNMLGNKMKDPFVTVGSHEPLEAGDAFLLCSDGLWNYFKDNELAGVVAKSTPRQGAEMLINKAIERAKGQGDNCTMAIIKLIKPPKEVPNYTIQKLRRAI